MKPGDVHRSSGIYLKTEQETSASKQSDEGCVTTLSLKWGPLPPNDVGMIVECVRVGEERKEREKESYFLCQWESDVSSRVFQETCTMCT